MFSRAARQMIVYVQWRFRRQPGLCAALPGLWHGPDVAVQAMSAQRRAAANAEALPVLLQLADSHADPRVRKNAAQAARTAKKTPQHHAQSARPDPPPYATMPSLVRPAPERYSRSR